MSCGFSFLSSLYECWIPWRKQGDGAWCAHTGVMGSSGNCIRNECVWNSRRLAEARKLIAQFCNKMMQEGRALVHEGCEGVLWVATEVSQSQRSTRTDVGEEAIVVELVAVAFFRGY